MIDKLKITEKITKIFLLVIILITIFVVIFNFFFNKKEKEVVIENEIKNFNYIQVESDIELFKTEFITLKNILDKDDINYEEYAKSISKLFIIDFYSLKNKTSSYDVGGVQFIYSEFKDNFSLKASDTIYKYLNPNMKELPLVKKVNVINIEETTFEYKEKEYQSYKVFLNWEYESDYGYEKECVLILMKENDRLDIVEKTNIS